jgi:hypothetical protein
VRLPLLALCALVATGCAGGSPSRRLPDGSRLIQKRDFQALYGPDGKIERLLQDKNGDKVADAVILYWRNGRPRQAEIDTNGDGAVDRWETFREDGSLETVARARRRGAQADQWDHFDHQGRFLDRELDEDGDGKVDRRE